MQQDRRAQNTQLLVFTDLDGTLLNHHDYSYEDARPALDRLQLAGIPVILTTSKTAAEVEALRRELDNHDPYIVENGSLYIVNDGETEYLASSYEETLAEIHALRAQYGFRLRGFHDLDDATVAEVTGLSPGDAHRARQRLSSEPILWDDSAERLQEFEACLGERGYRLLRGGRFYHVLGARAGKDRAMAAVAARYGDGESVVTVALGDSPNDGDMLEKAGVAVVIPAAAGKRLALKRTERTVYASQPGSAGWNTAVQRILDRYGF